MMTIMTRKTNARVRANNVDANDANTNDDANVVVVVANVETNDTNDTHTNDDTNDDDTSFMFDANDDTNDDAHVIDIDAIIETNDVTLRNANTTREMTMTPKQYASSRAIDAKRVRATMRNLCIDASHVHNTRYVFTNEMMRALDVALNVRAS